MAVVVPERDKASETARLLLELADSPYQVQTSTEYDGTIAFVVPDELHDKYLAHLDLARNYRVEAPTSEPTPEVPVKRGPGRPKKAQPATVEEE